ncbi:adenosylmethionine decarboxylase [Acidaminobacter hydrogenoformans]|uniref:S-adenosylmethionine decarboxylase proenzyme n=1 Tax=Acidaminobacter hydrogenoformans DSM 2784 TaxID=1120920 RepID=A0A1G5RV49_9FIRM|nr:adenosylmethionine decarboxylase [Acidaminobacter hydrogenoformans]SCZ77331.1 S-adenosylmethionine decarboxylase [Acidaminobacter hydrogenoformans DSM 2784]
MDDKLKLYGFNNLTKTLSFNIFDICYTSSRDDQKKYIDYIDEQYNAKRLTNILTEVTEMIGACILNIAKQDYDPEGASVTILISETPIRASEIDASCNMGQLAYRDAIVGHLDKSHITVHTYPESHPQDGISTFRVDIDVSTCGEISPLKALNHLIESFDSDIINLDYRVRGFTRDTNGQKFYIDHKITSIQDYISPDVLDRYNAIDTNVYQENIFHTKMLLRKFDLDNYLFSTEKVDLSAEERRNITKRLRYEMEEIYYRKNYL